MKTRTFRPVGNKVAACLMASAIGSLALAQPVAAQTQTNNLIIDSNLTTLSMPHVQACQQGFERLFGVPAGMDPDEALIVRGARQTYIEDHRVGDGFGSTLEIAMSFERALPPGPPDGAVLTGTLTCHYSEADAGGFPLTPQTVQLEEEGNTRMLGSDELSLFN